ncbi:MAG: hypothetical protein J6S85_12810 [Methanobrevibacter sp.]|nr:hypothetical protein [Methanobrevibacter sp.]
MIEIYCDNTDQMNCLKETIFHSEDCPFDNLYQTHLCPKDLTCYECITTEIRWYVKKKGGEN